MSGRYGCSFSGCPFKAKNPAVLEAHHFTEHGMEVDPQIEEFDPNMPQITPQGDNGPLKLETESENQSKETRNQSKETSGTINRQNIQNSFACEVESCDYQTTNRKTFEKHKFRKHGGCKSLGRKSQQGKQILLECPIETCVAVYSSKDALRKHIKLKHPDLLNQQESSKPKKLAAYFCKVEGCGAAYSTTLALKHHLIKKHESNPVAEQQMIEEKLDSAPRFSSFVCGVLLNGDWQDEDGGERCMRAFANRTEFLEHLSSEHNIHATNKEREFETYDLFMSWKTAYETANCIEFVCRTGKRARKAGEVVNYFCHRSSAFKSRSKGIRGPRKKGSVKLGFTCTAFMKAQIDHSTGQVQVLYCNTHYGHDRDLRHLRLPNELRNKVPTLFREYALPEPDLLQTTDDSARSEFEQHTQQVEYDVSQKLRNLQLLIDYLLEHGSTEEKQLSLESGGNALHDYIVSAAKLWSRDPSWRRSLEVGYVKRKDKPKRRQNRRMQEEEVQEEEIFEEAQNNVIYLGAEQPSYEQIPQDFEW